MREYREIPPSGAPRDAVECCWISMHATAHRVTPDGCADIVFRMRDGQPELLAVGPMTRFEDITQGGDDATLGIRFRPGMWTRVFGVPADALTGATLPLEELWGKSARTLRDRLAEETSFDRRAALLSELAAKAARERTPFQRAIGYLEKQRGLVSLRHLAQQTNVSTRQFRRVCLQETGLSPKLLARILRFRHAASRAGGERGQHAGLAVECGFADQAHMIAEFKRFSGRTPLTPYSAAING